MSSPLHTELSRRKFIGSCCAAVGATGLLSTLAQLRLIGAAVESGPAPTLPPGARPDYKALVCLFLAGGNDANNLIIPYDPAGYATYAQGRGALALPREDLLALTRRLSDGRDFALHPATPELRDLFTQGRLAVLANVGTLVVPTTRAQFQAKSVPLPNALFSHNDQQVQWQSSLPDSKLFTTGWGGRLADLTTAFNENNTISMSISLAGQNSFQVGKAVTQYAVSPNGAVQPNNTGGNVGALRVKARRELLKADDRNLFETAFAGLTNDAVSDSSLLASVLGKDAPFKTEFPKSTLGQQLRMIARLAASAPSLGLRRQIFFARIGGWDLHDHQVVAGASATGAHAKLLADVSQSLAAFAKTTDELGLADQITTFTASDFGRTWTTNGDGSDHGWGSHHLVMGGAVKGGDIYGRMPDFALNGPDDTGRGRWIPTTSVDEYNATLATWFGVKDTDLRVVLPNIGRFAKPNLGFLG
ncbi:MAG: DUF1501 domain-containing protein [Lacunisphaera sp.]